MWSTTRRRVSDLPPLVTARALTDAGVDPDVARRACAAGRWAPVLPGAWLRSPGPVSRRHRQAAALALLGPASALTGADACAALQLRDVPADPVVSVVVPAGCRRRLGPSVRLVATGRPVDTVVVSGLRTVEPHRAVVDAARRSTSLRDARALVTAAVADGRCSAEDLRAVLDAGPRNGSALCRRALAAADASCASAPEAEVAEAVSAAVRRRRLPRYALNPLLVLDGVVLGSPDGWLCGLGLGWELDSHRHHSSPDDLDATLLRHERFARAGLDLLHVTPTRFRRDPDAFVQALCARAAERRQLFVPEPPGLHVHLRSAHQVLLG